MEIVAISCLFEMSRILQFSLEFLPDFPIKVFVSAIDLPQRGIFQPEEIKKYNCSSQTLFFFFWFETHISRF